MASKTILTVEDLQIAFKTAIGFHKVLHGVSFSLNSNEILGIVGESGSGKSVLSLAIMGLLPKNKCELSGKIFFEDSDLVHITKKEQQKIRGQKIAMVFQEPMSALNPSMQCGKQLEELYVKHCNLKVPQAKSEVLKLMTQVKLPDPEIVYSKYPHELSGGQQQRVVIAMAIALKPQIIIADEPTTALDVTVQKEIIGLLQNLQKKYKISILFISHDLTLVSEIANKVIVMNKGQIIEQGATNSLFTAPQEQYTKALIAARPSLNVRLKNLQTVANFYNNSVKTEVINDNERKKQHALIYSKPPILEVINLNKTYFSKSSWLGKSTSHLAVAGVSFSLYEGETLGLVGESGCGKSTLAKAILCLDKANDGKLLYRGKDLMQLTEKEIRKMRKDIQIIFQDPYASLNPRMPIGKAIMEPMKVHGLYGSDKERELKALELLEKVGLDPDHFQRYPHEFSGGQRQRIGIARTIALQPKIIICDESVSALDISVQAQVLNLLNTLKEQYKFTYIFISHDLAVVKYMSDQLLVMKKGSIEEQGESDEIYKSPKKEYTKKLINAIPKGL